MQSKLEAYLNAKEYVSHTLLNLFLEIVFFKLSREGHTEIALEHAVSRYYGNICQLSFPLC